MKFKLKTLIVAIVGITLTCSLALAKQIIQVTDENLSRVVVSSTTVGEAVVEVKMKNGIGFATCSLANGEMASDCLKLSLIPIPPSEGQIGLVNAKFEKYLENYRDKKSATHEALDYAIASVVGTLGGGVSAFVGLLATHMAKPVFAEKYGGKVMLGGVAAGVGISVKWIYDRNTENAIRANDLESILGQSNIALTETERQEVAAITYDTIKSSLSRALSHLEIYTNPIDGTEFIRFRRD